MNPMFKRKLQLTIPVLILLLLLALNSGQSMYFTMGLLTGFAIVLTALYLKFKKEDANPSYFQDERTLQIAYRADSISLRIMILFIALLFFLESFYQISQYITLYAFLSCLLSIGLVLKISVFYVLNRL